MGAGKMIEYAFEKAEEYASGSAGTGPDRFYILGLESEVLESRLNLLIF